MIQSKYVKRSSIQCKTEKKQTICIIMYSIMTSRHRLIETSRHQLIEYLTWKDGHNRRLMRTSTWPVYRDHLHGLIACLMN